MATSTFLSFQARNKPKEAPKAPAQAPFFLPTLGGLERDIQFALPGDSSSSSSADDEEKRADRLARSRILHTAGPDSYVKSPLVLALEQSLKDQNGWFSLNAQSLLPLVASSFLFCSCSCTVVIFICLLFVSSISSGAGAGLLVRYVGVWCGLGDSPAGHGDHARATRAGPVLGVCPHGSQPITRRSKWQWRIKL